MTAEEFLAIEGFLNRLWARTGQTFQMAYNRKRDAYEVSWVPTTDAEKLQARLAPPIPPLALTGRAVREHGFNTAMLAYVQVYFEARGVSCRPVMPTS